jgi:hypothetical protein
MTWVKANPLRDPGVFCGAVGCGLCFDWADDASEEVTAGIKWIAQQLLGREDVTPAEMEMVREGLLRAHGALVVPSPPVLPGDYDEAQQISRIAIQARGVLQRVVASRVAAKSTRKRSAITIDQMPEADVKKAAKPKKAPVNVGFDEYAQITERALDSMVDQMAKAAFQGDGPGMSWGGL